ncbi:MAG: hypothetical protein ACQEVA_23400 [Myxococcota bacterium]
MTDEFDDMEEWMTTWQTEKKNVSWSREDFAQRRIWQYIKDIGSLLALAFAAVVMAWKLFDSNVAIVVNAVVFIGYFALSAWSIVSRIRRQREALPLSVPEYLHKMRHNLALRDKQLRWEQWSLPPILVFATGAIVWITWSKWEILAAEPYRLAVVAAAVAIGFPYALYVTFKKKPAEIRSERERLDDIERDLEE